MKIKPQIREGLGFLLAISLATLALISALNYQDSLAYFQQMLKTGIRISRSVARYEEKLTCLQTELNPEETVGFITLLPSAQAAEYHALTQYALVPILVENSTEKSRIVGYVPNPDDLQIILANHPDYRIIKDCRNEIVLFENLP